MGEAKILVVEDEFIIAKEIQMSLEHLGYEVVGTSASSEKALRQAEEFHPDLVLMDIMIQGDMDGIETAAQLKKHYGIPVIYLTSYTNKSILDRAKLTSPYGYLVKPFRENDLYAAIEITLHKIQEHQNLEMVPAAPSPSSKPLPSLAPAIQALNQLPPGRPKTCLLESVTKIEQYLGKLLYIQAKGPHTEMFLDSVRQPSIPLSVSLQQLTDYCEESILLKIHRSYLVLPDRVLYIKKNEIRDYELWLRQYSRQPVCLPVGRSILPSLRQMRPDWFILRN